MSPRSESRRLMCFGSIAFSALAVLSGCTTGPLKVHEEYYYKAQNGEHANYFRLTVDAQTKLGNAEYRTGWFPARSVDSLFGEVTSESGDKVNQTRQALIELINTNVFTTTKLWFEAVMTNAPQAELDRLNDARRNLLSYPVARPSQDVVLLEYNPINGLINEHADEKFVILLSSNPDEIIGKIAAFTEQEKTAGTIQKLSSVFLQKQTENMLTLSAVESGRKGLDALLYRQLQAVSEAINPDTTTEAEALEQIGRLLTTAELTKP